MEAICGVCNMNITRITDWLHDFQLDIYGQQPGINRLYTQLTFCFAISDDSLDSLIRTLKEGIERLSANFPWVAGKVVNDNGRFKIVPLEKAAHFVVRDLRCDPSVPDWDTIRPANFPFSMLDESIVAPCKTLAVTDVSALELPVFMVQTNFIVGGLLLTFNAQHGSMDMAGQSQIISLLAKACRGEPFSRPELSIGNMKRKNIIPLLDNCVPESELKEQSVKDSPNGDIKPVRAQWAYFTFSGASLALLKADASQTAPPPFISTDDALSAFIWQCLSRARQPRHRRTPSALSTLSRNVDARRALALPSTYPGLAVSSTAHTAALDAVAAAPLGAIAGRLRAALDPAALAHGARALATRIAHGGIVGFGAGGAPDRDVRLSSWAKERCCEVDFGFACAEAVRRPRFEDGAREGLVYLLPKTREGEIVVGVCLRGDDLERLKGDVEWARVAAFVG